MAHRNRERERRTSSDLALHPDPSTMQLDELPRQCQPQARALDLLRRHPDLLELFEDGFLILGGYADSGVADRHFDGAIDGHGPNLDPATLRRELDRIRQKIEEDLADLPLVGLDLAESFVNTLVQVDPPARCSLADQHQGIVDGRR